MSLKPYFETDGGRLYHGDCLGLELEEKAALICIDPPYNIGKDTWDKIANYEAWMGEVFKHCEKSLADNGSFYWFHNKMPVIARLMEWLRINTDFIFKQLIVWNKYFKEASNVGFYKQHLMIYALRNYQTMAEYCLFYTFQDDSLLSVQCKHENYAKIKNEISIACRSNKHEIIKKLCTYYSNAGIAKLRLDNFTGKATEFRMMPEKIYLLLSQIISFSRPYKAIRKEYEDLRKEYEGLRYTFNNQKVTGDFSFQYQDWNNSVWNYSAAPQIGHLTPKPVRLIENILKHSSSEMDLIVDFFGGSGTTAIACENLNRRWVLIEKEEQYCEIAAKRLEAATSQMRF